MGLESVSVGDIMSLIDSQLKKGIDVIRLPFGKYDGVDSVFAKPLRREEKYKGHSFSVESVGEASPEKDVLDLDFNNYLVVRRNG